MIRLIDVHNGDPAVEIFLYDLLAERLTEPATNISHQAMPTLAQHREFITGRPYFAWYAIQNEDNALVGAVHLTLQNALGIVVAKAHRRKGYARAGLQEFMRRTPPLIGLPSQRPDHYVANIRDGNQASIALFESLGATILQHTYKL